MNNDLLKRVIELASRQPYVWLATTDQQGRPHVTTAGTLLAGKEGRVILREWFCPVTLANTRYASAVSVVVWAGGETEGFQIIGQVQAVTDFAVLDGFNPSMENEPPMPQTQRDLTIDVETILHFRHGPHTDEPA
jgi:hypothetical protein